jgi:hypothetical protein
MTGSLHLQDCPCKLNLLYVIHIQSKLLQIARPTNILLLPRYLYSYICCKFIIIQWPSVLFCLCCLGHHLKISHHCLYMLIDEDYISVVNTVCLLLQCYGVGRKSRKNLQHWFYKVALQQVSVQWTFLGKWLQNSWKDISEPSGSSIWLRFSFAVSLSTFCPIVTYSILGYKAAFHLCLESCLETVGTSVTARDCDDLVMTEMTHLNSVEQDITAAIENSVDFDWIRSTGCSLHHQWIVGSIVRGITRISIPC